ncbi:methyl-accepting chemotaxis protein [Corallococcus carmarthensis]|uniref:Methyl-accepting chemotaxis protein n=1 Tax=Corallococcus carmarthensis TaxID=2316728 RepID=A0A3A8KS31_9BACT|nr:HAMP domain-containing methyl-accepting chemotaxis protein [Corallococcus carmarthensis]NOK22987.1 methyl-accepting chemotaxis protein [Corallococcus carmarthensis]RKH04774.1 methyl-accepting chemotaxis protein [Corallococcus carmarthensis]
MALPSREAPRRAAFSRQLMAPIPLANLVGSTLGLHFASLVVGDKLVQRLGMLVVLVVGVSALHMLLGVGVSLRRFPRLRALERGELSPTPEHLALVVGEVARAPGEAFFGSLALWGLTTGVVATALWSWMGLEGNITLRVAWLGALFGPLTSLLVYGLVTLRARRGVLWVAEQGLTHAQVIAALPRRSRIRARLVAFTAICVLTPAVMCAQVVTALTDRVFSQLERNSLDAQGALVDALRLDAFTASVLLGAVVFGLALATAYLGGTLLGRPMRELSGEARRIAAGDLASPRLVPAEDEVWAVSAAFTTMRTHLADVLSELQRAGSQISATTEEILSTSGRYEAGAAEQASSLDETSATTEELARSAKQIADNASSVAEIAQRTLAAAQGGQRSAESFLGAMSRMRQDNQAIGSAVARLNKRVQQIGKIVEFINGVADKSDLLALNAELEGTKAGEVGRGFSLVAAEMRRLAENVLESTKEIEGLIEEVREASAAAVTVTGGGVRAVETGTGLAEQVSESLRQIVSLAGQTSDAVRIISRSTQQQQAGTDQLADTMADILRITQQSLNATKQVGAANGDLLGLAQDLRGVVERFQIHQATLRKGGGG